MKIPTIADSHGTREALAVLGLRTLGRSLRERGVRGEGARMALTAVARVFDALLLMRRVGPKHRTLTFVGVEEVTP